MRKGAQRCAKALLACLLPRNAFHWKAILRVRNIPARYVAGLIPGEGETHAWVELYDGAGFIGVDSTQLRLADDGYLRVNVGRDSRDCAINRGMFTGMAQQSMEVCARMLEI